jgi:hypothetical protein
MDQVNSKIYNQLNLLVDLKKAADKKFIQKKYGILVSNFGANNGFFFLLEIQINKVYKGIVRVWQNHQAEVMAFFDTDWHSVYTVRKGIEFPDHDLRKQANQQLQSLLN